MLDAASVPATIVNWGGDDAISPNQWCALFGELSGREPVVEVQQVPGSQIGAILDNTRRLSITGPCTMRYPDAFRDLYETRYPDGPDAGPVGMSSPL